MNDDTTIRPYGLARHNNNSQKPLEISLFLPPFSILKPQRGVTTGGDTSRHFFSLFFFFYRKKGGKKKSLFVCIPFFFLLLWRIFLHIHRCVVPLLWGELYNASDKRSVGIDGMWLISQWLHLSFSLSLYHQVSHFYIWRLSIPCHRRWMCPTIAYIKEPDLPIGWRAFRVFFCFFFLLWGRERDRQQELGRKSNVTCVISHAMGNNLRRIVGSKRLYGWNQRGPRLLLARWLGEGENVVVIHIPRPRHRRRLLIRS